MGILIFSMIEMIAIVDRRKGAGSENCCAVGPEGLSSPWNQEDITLAWQACINRAKVIKSIDTESSRLRPNERIVFRRENRKSPSWVVVF